MRKRRIAAILAGVYGAGALTMYFFDPQRGRRRRAELRDAVNHSRSEMAKFTSRFGRDLANRVEGVTAEAKQFLDHASPTDYVLEQKVHTALGRVVSHPGAIDVSAKNGCVFLNGWVLAEEANEVAKAVASIDGVKDFTSYLRTPKRPERILALQGGAGRLPVPEFRQQWSPTSRVAAGSLGLGLALYGKAHWGSFRNPLSLAGALLLTRSAVNRPWAAIVGSNKAMGINVQKTMYISAEPAELYQFWNNPENYPKAFSHVVEVTRLEDDVYQWRFLGLAGIPLKWTGAIIRRVPEKLIEWRSVPGSAMENHGVIHLEPGENGQTRIHIQMSYHPPAGLLGHTFAALLGFDPKSLLDHDLIALKALFERGSTTVRGREVAKNELASPAAS